jgi:hypothetical protein
MKLILEVIAGGVVAAIIVLCGMFTWDAFTMVSALSGQVQRNAANVQQIVTFIQGKQGGTQPTPQTAPNDDAQRE